MNQTLRELRTIADRERARFLPEVTAQNLEKSGALFYMNGQNGTEFDWYVNDRLSSFMVFYNDEANLGAVKLYLNRSATADVFLYGEQGKKFLKQVTVPVEVTEQELLELAVLLRREADDKRLWDADIEALNTDDVPTPRHCGGVSKPTGSLHCHARPAYPAGQAGHGSKKILDEGWKVGYMERVEPHDAEDSGWFFASGTEDQGYLDDCHNIQLLPVGVYGNNWTGTFSHTLTVRWALADPNFSGSV